MEAARRHTDRLTAAVDDVRAALDRIAALEAWLDDVTHAHLSREYTVHSDAELQQFTDNFQVCPCDAALHDARRSTGLVWWFGVVVVTRTFVARTMLFYVEPG